MIVHVLQRAKEANIGPIYVACAESEIAEAVTLSGGRAILTDPKHPSGTDRIFEAMNKIPDIKKYDVVINLQGDLPTINPKAIRDILLPLKNRNVDISTLVAKIKNKEEEKNPNVVKAIADFSRAKKVAIATDFKRKLKAEDKNFYHHIGIYGYRKTSLEKFTKLKQSDREKSEKLEQLRALDNDMVIGVSLIDTVPFGVDTPEDLEMARRLLG